MRRLLRVLPLLLLLVALRPLPSHAAEFRSNNDTLTLSTPLSRDTFAASHTISVTAPISGEAFMAGNTITVDQALDRSAYIIGSTITVNKSIGYNLFATGNAITLHGTVNNDVYLAGSSITIGKDAVINGELWVEGGNLTLDGTVKGAAHLDVTTFTSSGTIGGSVTGNIETASFTGGTIGGDFHYTSDTDATGLNTVKISGKTTRDTPSNTSSTAWDIIKVLLTAMVATLLLGSLLAYRFPGTMLDLTDRVRANYGAALLRGLGWLIIVPLLTIVLVVTIIGWKVALFIGLLYLLSLVIAGVLSCFLIGHWFYTRFFPGHRENIWDYLLIGILATHILSAVPVIGEAFALVFFIVALVPSLGALTYWATERE